MKHEEIHIPTPDPAHPYPGDGHYRFPALDSVNLLGDCVALPPILPNSLQIILVVFSPEYLSYASSWRPIFSDLHHRYQHSPNHVEYWTALVLQLPPQEGDLPAFQREIGDTDDYYIRTRSVLSYADQLYVRRRLSIPKNWNAALLVLDGTANILWKDDATLTADREEHLNVILDTLAPISNPQT